MIVVKKSSQLQKLLQKARDHKKRIGFVPTMGALHEGHLSLIRAARKENDIVVVSVFVNPTQFGPKEDFKKYPRPKQKDEKLLKKEKVNYLFSPGLKDIYPETPIRHIRVSKRDGKYSLTNCLCGRYRPGHFKGVATVVSRLFLITKPDRVYFGAKDYQQSVVVAQLIKDMKMKIKLRVMPIIRERDGLALSSRNRYLTSTQRERAVEISRTLFWMRRQYGAGTKSLRELRFLGLKRLKQAVTRLQYLEIVDPYTLRVIKKRQKEAIIATACYVGKTRLIDNVIMRPSRRPRSKA